MHSNVYSSTIYNSQDMEATEMSINRGMNKEEFIYIYTHNIILISQKKNEIMLFAATWIDLQIIILRETKKDKYQSSHCGSVLTNPTRIHEDEGTIPSLGQWVKDPALLWLWCRLAATALI